MSDEQLDLTDIEARRDEAYADGSWDEPEWRDIIALLAEVKRFRAQVADVWDEGFTTGQEHESHGWSQAAKSRPWPKPPDNPYRKSEGTP